MSTVSSQATTQLKLTERDELPALPRGPLSPQQQLEALRRVQAQAEQRVKLGVQLFKAAEARAAQHSDVLDQVKAEQQQLRQQVNEEIATNRAQCEQLLTRYDDDFAAKVQALEQRVDSLQSQWQTAQRRIEEMLGRAESMAEQSQTLLTKPAPDRAHPPIEHAVTPVTLPLATHVKRSTRDEQPADLLALAAQRAGDEGKAALIASPPMSDHVGQGEGVAGKQVASDPALPRPSTIYSNLLGKLRERLSESA